MTQVGSLALIGGHPALDFANTAGWHASDHRSEWLTDYGALLDWARHAGVLTPARAAHLAARAQAHPGKAGRTLKHAVEVRELIYRIFARLAAGFPPEPADLDRLRMEEIQALRASRPAWKDGALNHDWPARDDLLQPLYPIVLSAVRLLQDPPLDRLRQCGNHPCGWLFIDRSRSGTRRWCSSSECGNQTRVRRFRAKR